jgi:tetratricopeptide (TPR) repeat protein/tRNA A-37 threonylcarbamoyl transferase component Bud32
MFRVGDYFEEFGMTPDVSHVLRRACSRPFDAARVRNARSRIDGFLDEDLMLSAVSEVSGIHGMHEHVIMLMSRCSPCVSGPPPYSKLTGTSPNLGSVAMAVAADRHLLFGLLALQNAIITQNQLLAAFQAWTLEKSRSLADHLEACGALDAAKRALLEALTLVHLQAHGGDAQKSLAAIFAGKSTQESLARIDDPEINATLGHVGSAQHSTYDDPNCTATYSVGSATSDGQRFHILRPHAKGGLGAVFVALDGELNREVAVKQILDSHADDLASRARFLLEAEITGGLEHPGIVPVYGLGAYGGGRPFYAMRFIRGESLKEAIGNFHGDETLRNDPSRRSLELRKLLRRFMDVCNAIGYAHSRGVLHRDIKPGNVIVGKHGETLVVDWGLAKATGKSDPSAGERTLLPSSASGSSETLPGSALGTPAYMSPEQADGNLEALGPRSDVFSLGATLYCLLTGRPPVEGDDIGSVLRAVQRGEFAPPRQVEPSIDPALAAVCQKAMALQPAHRYATPKELVEEIERWMADEPVTAWREPFTRRARRWGRRNRTAVATLAATVLMALAGTGAVLAVQTKANYDLKQANADLAVANAQVKKSNADLEVANQRERERFDLAMSAIKMFHGEVSEDLLMKEKQFEALRTKLLRGAADFYGKLEGLLKGQTDSKSRAALGKAYEELGDLTGKIGKKPEALAVHVKALAVRRELAAAASGGPTAEPAWREARLDVARSLIAAGLLRAETGDIPGALASYQEAQALAEELDMPGHADAAVRAVLGSSHARIARLFLTKGKIAEALAECEQARAIRQTLADADPAVTQYQSDLASSHLEIALLQGQTGRLDESLAAFEQSRAILQKLVDANATDIQFQRNLSNSTTGIGWVLGMKLRPAEALVWYERGREILQKMAEANPNVTDFQRELAVIHNNIGMLFTQTGRPSEALAEIEKGREIRQALAAANPRVTLFQRDLAISLIAIGQVRQENGQVTEVVETYRKALAILERLPVLPPLDHFNIASLHAGLAGVATRPGSGLSAAEQRAEADLAMTWIRKAVDGGYRPIAQMRVASVLDSLRSRPDYQLLLMDLTFPSEPFARSR